MHTRKTTVPRLVNRNQRGGFDFRRRRNGDGTGPPSKGNVKEWRRRRDDRMGEKDDAEEVEEVEEEDDDDEKTAPRSIAS